MAQFPPAGMASGEDSAYFTHKRVEEDIEHKTEGGYTISRPRHTRRIMQYTTGFTEIEQADKDLLFAFVESKRARQPFTWREPTSGVTLTVCFANKPTFRYVGMGGVHLWTIADIVLETI